MKWQIWKKLKQAPKLNRSDILLTALPAALWLLTLYSRPFIMDLHCTKDPLSCQKSQIFKPDQLSLENEYDTEADNHSFLTQNLTAYLAVGVPIAFGLTRIFINLLSPTQALIQVGADLLILGQSIAWNGAINETLRLIVQRPRPFVYQDPFRLGSDPAHYTSFYSGHTSFVASSGSALVFSLLGRSAPTWFIALISIGVGILIFLTGLFRVLSSRHFITDVLFAAFAGILISAWIALIHRRRKK